MSVISGKHQDIISVTVSQLSICCQQNPSRRIHPSSRVIQTSMRFHSNDIKHQHNKHCKTREVVVTKSKFCYISSRGDHCQCEYYPVRAGLVAACHCCGRHTWWGPASPRYPPTASLPRHPVLQVWSSGQRAVVKPVQNHLQGVDGSV